MKVLLASSSYSSCSARLSLAFACLVASFSQRSAAVLLRGNGLGSSSFHGSAGTVSSANVSLNASSNVSSEQSSFWQQEAARFAMNSSEAMLIGLQAKEPEMEVQQCDIQRQYTSEPALCAKGKGSISRSKLMTYLKDFQQVWSEFKSQLPGPTCCMGINHQFAIYVTVRELQPLVIIESGVAAGRGTWLLRRSAGPAVPIFSLDPGDPILSYGPYRGWKDNSGKTTYLVGGLFKDLAMQRWDTLIPDPKIRARTLVILDDHQSSVERLKMLRNWGFRHVFYEDNYPFGVATSADKYTCSKLGAALPRVFTKTLYGDAYSPNTVCSAVPKGWNFVLEKDRFGHKCKFLTLDQHSQNVNWFQKHLDGYFEFPALFSRCTGLQRSPLLGSDPATLLTYGFPTPQEELWQYGHLFPALMSLKPLSTETRTVYVGGMPKEVSEQSEGVQAALEGAFSIYQEVVSGTWP